MSKKIGKILLATAALTTAAAAAYYYLRKKDADSCLTEEDEEDFDDFCNNPDDADTASRTYVPLNREEAATAETTEAQAKSAKTQTKVTEAQLESAAIQPEATEEFFDEEDPEDAKLPIQD